MDIPVMFDFFAVNVARVPCATPAVGIVGVNLGSLWSLVISRLLICNIWGVSIVMGGTVPQNGFIRENLITLW